MTSRPTKRAVKLLAKCYGPRTESDDTKVRNTIDKFILSSGHLITANIDSSYPQNHLRLDTIRVAKDFFGSHLQRQSKINTKANIWALKSAYMAHAQSLEPQFEYVYPGELLAALDGLFEYRVDPKRKDIFFAISTESLRSVLPSNVPI